jgi:capsular exopolysaccharide synthesis family protein
MLDPQTQTGQPLPPSETRAGALVVREVPQHGPLAAALTPPPRLNRAVPQRRPITVAFVLQAMQRWWMLALPVALTLFTVLVAAVWYFYKPVYQAEAWLRINDHNPYIAFPDRQNGTDRFVRTQVELLRSPIVLDRVLTDPEIARLPELRDERNPLVWLQRHLAVRSVEGSELFQVMFETTNPKNASAMVNAVLDSYLKVQSEAAAGQSQQIIELLEQELERRSRDLERLKQNVRTLTKNATGRDPMFNEGDNKVVMAQQSPLASLEQQLMRTEMERTMLETRQNAYEETIAQQDSSVDDESIDQMIEDDPGLAEIKALIESRKGALAKHQSVAAGSTQSDFLGGLKTEIQEAEALLEKRRQDIRSRMIRQQEQLVKQQHDAELTRMTLEIESQRKLEAQLHEKIAAERAELEKLSHRSLDLEFGRGDLERAEHIYQMIADRAEALKTELIAPERVMALRRSTPPNDPIALLPYKPLMAGGLIMLTLPFALCVMWEYRIHRIAESQQIFEETSVPVVGEVTALPMQLNRMGGRLSRRGEQHRQTFRESIDYVRTSLTLSDKLSSHQVLTVASAVSREGKTSLASQLAVSLAQSGSEPVLLIDADLRAPDLHEWLEIPIEPGLTKVLAQSCPSEEAIVPTWCENLYFLPAGRLDRPPYVLLGNGRFKAVLDELRPRFRYIVVDAPPVLPTSDALIIAHAADATLLATMRNVTRTHQLKSACDRLRAAGANLIGAVLSGVPWKSYTYQYGAYGYHDFGNGNARPEPQIDITPLDVEPTVDRSRNT